MSLSYLAVPKTKMASVFVHSMNIPECWVCQLFVLNGLSCFLSCPWSGVGGGLKTEENHQSFQGLAVWGGLVVLSGLNYVVC